MILNFTHFCLNKHTAGLPHGCVYCGRGSDWGNPFRTEKAGGKFKQGQAVGEHEFWLAQPDQAHLLRRIDELRGKQLVCFCMPKMCHTNTLAFLANSNRDTRIRWWRFMRTLRSARTLSDLHAWDIFVTNT